MNFYVYMLRCEDNSIYTGFTTDIKRRWEEHKKRSKKAKYTLSHPVKSLDALFFTNDKKTALKLEYYIKRLSKDKKEEIIKNPKLIYEYLGDKIQDIKDIEILGIKSIF